MLEALNRSKCYNRIGHSWSVGGQRESGPSVDIGLGIYGLVEDNVIMPKLEPDVNYLHGPRWLLEWQLLSSWV